MKSPKEISVNEKIVTLTKEIIDLSDEKDLLPLKVLEILIDDEEIQAVQDYANSVSIVRLGYNDHGPVHMRTVCRNALKMLKILHQAGIQTSLEKEQSGNFSDSITAVILASFMHDFGMTIGRQDHELYSGIIAYDIINRVLEKALPYSKNDDDESTDLNPTTNLEKDEFHEQCTESEKKDGMNSKNCMNLKRRIVIRSVAMEGILGHMGTRKIHSLEAGLIQIADGCDMKKGRARIPMELNKHPCVGDIHKYSANSIEKVKILAGKERPIRIEICMSADVGFFQIEEVLLQKISASPAKNLIELYAGVEGQDSKQYL